LESAVNNAFESALNLRTNIARNWLEEASLGRQRHYEAVLLAEDGGAPPDFGPGVEVDQWVGSPMCYEICTLKLPGEDFAKVDELHQRFFLLLAAEVLFGPRYDARLLAEAVMMAHDS
jgi:hypothetical protein